MEHSELPQCVGFIMDGNRRWAKQQGLETLEGHRIGLLDTFTDVIRWVRDLGIKHAVFYAFSTENWRRSSEEVGYLMDLFRLQLRRMDEQSSEEKVRFRVVGRATDFAEDIQQLMKELEAKTAQYTTTTIWLCLSYGGRVEIVEAVKRLVASGAEVSEASLAQYLWTAEMPDPDLIIRTSGEQRLSNFLPWQSIYSELFFTPTYWPAFTKDEFERMLEDYAHRQRRHGV